jgi:hypothetical protein
MGSRKSEIGWTRRLEDGTKVDVAAHRNGVRWVFEMQTHRYEPWEEMKTPLLEDWLELLAAVERRVIRRTAKPEEPDRIRKLIRERFPEHQFE